MEGLQSHPYAQGNAPVSTSVPALMAGANERSLTSDVSGIGGIAMACDVIDDNSRQATLYANAMERANAAGSSTLLAIAAMAIYSHAVVGDTPEVTTDPKGSVAQAFWRSENVKRLKARIANRIGFKETTAARYLRLAVGLAHLPTYGDMVPPITDTDALASAEAVLVDFMRDCGGRVEDVAEVVGVKWSGGAKKATAEDDGESDPFAPPTAEAEAAKAEASKKKVERLNKTLSTDERAGIITLAAVRQWAAGFIAHTPEQGEALEALAALISNRVDVSREAREAAAAEAAAADKAAMAGVLSPELRDARGVDTVAA